MYNIIGKRYWFFLISGVLILISIISLSTAGLKSGIEFSSGSILQVQFETPVDYAQFKAEIIALGYNDAIVQTVGENEYLIRTHEITEEEKIQLEADLATRFGGLTESQFYSVSPLVASETVRSAIIAVVVAMVGILLYVTWAFRRMPNAFRWGTCSIIALFHDALVTVGLFSAFGALLGWEINLMFITGILTVIGYSVNNTIVVFDRIRENEMKGVSANFETIVNNSQVETMGRSLNSSITTLITLLPSCSSSAGPSRTSSLSCSSASSPARSTPFSWRRDCWWCGTRTSGADSSDAGRYRRLKPRGSRMAFSTPVGAARLLLAPSSVCSSSRYWSVLSPAV
jgi:preprotein translocase subunit SecF